MFRISNEGVKRACYFFLFLSLLAGSQSESFAQKRAGSFKAANAPSSQLHAGLFRAGTFASDRLTGLEWSEFHMHWQALEKKGLRMIDFETYTEGSKRLYAGVFRSGNDAVGAIIGREWSEFLPGWQALEKKGLRMIDFETYTAGGKRLYAGIFRAGTYAVGAFIGKEWDEFLQKWQELEDKNLRMVDIEIYSEGNRTLFAGIFHAGTDAKGALVGVEWNPFIQKSKEIENKGLRMIDFETYTVGGKRLYAGIFRAGTDAHAAWVGVDEENFKSQQHSLEEKNLRLTDIEFYSSACEAACLNQVVPESGGPYTRSITSTALHCAGLPGTCGTPSANATVLYSAPWYEEGGDRYARLSAIYHSDQFLTLPFTDPDVKPSGMWRYSNSTYHHAGDYSKGSETFQVRASAPGRVIHIGWDNWGGGTIVISHDAGGVKDAYRTIYRHLRNGRDNDCESAWSKSVPPLSGDTLADYTAYLEMSGCAKKKADRAPEEKYWGKNSEAINLSLLGKNVSRGQMIAWAGNTGPGGKKGTSESPNTHLHIFWAHRDPSDSKWYFFDPYGIYAKPDCYPAKVTDPVNTPCARYPVVWKDGKPQYPQPIDNFADSGKK